MPDIAPASMAADLAPTQPRPIERLYTLGVRDCPPILVAICADNTIWQLDQRLVGAAWEQLPPIPGVPLDDLPY
jgi:hypothetical protein